MLFFSHTAKPKLTGQGLSVTPHSFCCCDNALFSARDFLPDSPTALTRTPSLCSGLFTPSKGKKHSFQQILPNSLVSSLLANLDVVNNSISTPATSVTPVYQSSADRAFCLFFFYYCFFPTRGIRKLLATTHRFHSPNNKLRQGLKGHTPLAAATTGESRVLLHFSTLLHLGSRAFSSYSRAPQNRQTGYSRSARSWFGNSRTHTNARTNKLCSPRIRI